MRLAAIVFVAAVALPAISGEILLQGDDPIAVSSANPANPAIRSAAQAAGGLDEGLPGDESCYMISVTDVGKSFYQTPDSISLFLDTTSVEGELTVQVSIYMGTYGSRNGQVLWDGVPIAGVDSYGRGNERVETVSATIAPSPGIHELRIADRPGEGSYINIDAIKLAADGDLVLVDAEGTPVDLHSPAVPPGDASVLHQTLDKLPNLAVIGDGVRWYATESFPVPAYDLRAAFDGDPDDNDYWAGGTPPPHAATIEFATPAAFDTCRITWLGLNRGVIYGLEAFDGQRWQLVFHEPHNLAERPVYEFPPITATRVRFTLFSVTGQQRVLMKLFELFDRDGGDPQ